MKRFSSCLFAMVLLISAISFGGKGSVFMAGAETAKYITRDDGIDIDKYNGRLEAEAANPDSGELSSYNITQGSENGVTYMEWDAKDWGNAKWIVYFRQAGTYEITYRAKVTVRPENLELYLVSYDQALNEGDINDVQGSPNFKVSQEFADYKHSKKINVDYAGSYAIKLMDADGNPKGKFMLDYLDFVCVTPKGEKDESEDSSEMSDPTDEAVPNSNGEILKAKAVDVFLTSTEMSGDRIWYEKPIDMANKLTQKDSLDITTKDTQEFTTINIDPDKTYQTMLGVGTSLEESTINNMLQLTPAMQDEFLRKLVDPNQGGMTLFRLTIGTSDFTAQKFYTYYDAAELADDNAIYDKETKEYLPDWNNETGRGFSIQKDRDYGIIATAKRVLELAEEYGVADDIKFFSSSWTPPGFMKKPTSASKSYKDNGLLLKGGALNNEHIDNLAMYYTRYLEEYAKEGIPIYAMTLQNEPLLEIDYPSCAMTGAQEGKLALALKKAVQASGILSASAKGVKIWAYDHNASEADAFVREIFNVPGAREAVDGIAFHDYSGSMETMQKVLDTRLNKDGRTGQTVNLTERSVWGTRGANSIISYFRNSAISYNSWVTMLDSNIGVHQWVGVPDPSMFTRQAGDDTKYWATPEFYMAGQFSRFIRPGSVRVDSTATDYNKAVSNVVYYDPDAGKLIAVVVNGTRKKQDFKLVCGDSQIIGSLPAGNIGTYIWEPLSEVVLPSASPVETASADSSLGNSPSPTPSPAGDGGETPKDPLPLGLWIAAGAAVAGIAAGIFFKVKKGKKK